MNYFSRKLLFVFGFLLFCFSMAAVPATRAQQCGCECNTGLRCAATGKNICDANTTNGWCCWQMPGASCNTNTNCGGTYECEGACVGGANCTAQSKVCVNGTCQTQQMCTAESDATFCSRNGKNCGSFSGTDNCNAARTANCGTCTTGTCTANVCTQSTQQGTISSFTMDKSVYTLGNTFSATVKYSNFSSGQPIGIKVWKKDANGTYQLQGDSNWGQTDTSGTFTLPGNFPATDTSLIGFWKEQAHIGTVNSGEFPFEIKAATGGGTTCSATDCAACVTQTACTANTSCTWSNTSCVPKVVLSLSSDRSVYRTGDPFVITVTGGQPNSVVEFLFWNNDVAYNAGCGAGTWCRQGTTDATGKLVLSGTMNGVPTGTWKEQARVGGVTSNLLYFRVDSTTGNAMVLGPVSGVYAFPPGQTVQFRLTGGVASTPVQLYKWFKNSWVGKEDVGTTDAQGVLTFSKSFASADSGTWTYVAFHYDSMFSPPLNFAITATLPPEITGISPSSGVAPDKLPYLGGKGTTVTITGKNFGPAYSGQVMFTTACDGYLNMTSAGWQSWTDTQIITDVPWKATSGPVKIWKSNGGVDIYSSTYNFTVTNPCPTGAGVAAVLSSISPASVRTGDTITITGSGFGPSAITTGDRVIMTTCGTNGALTSAGVAASSWSDTQIKFTVPANGASGQVYVNAAGKSSNTINLTVTNSTCGQAALPPVTPPPPTTTGGASCTNPSTVPAGFATPCPVFGAQSPSSGTNASINLSAITGATAQYIYTKVYVAEQTNATCPNGTAKVGGAWCQMDLQMVSGTYEPNQSNNYISKNTGATMTLPMAGFSRGAHWVVLWDWNWDASKTCYLGPAGNACFVDANNMGGATWRIQLVTIP